MSEPENFLTRWSRRKLVPDQDKPASPQPAAPGSTQSASHDAKPVVSPDAPAAKVPEFDLSSLPAIESITAATDLSQFLLPGVPLSLQRAALRRAWLLDPPSRESLLMAEYAWDFTVPDATIGFGSLGPSDELRAMVDRLTGRPDTTAPADTPARASAARLPQGEDTPTTAELSDSHVDRPPADEQGNTGRAKEEEPREHVEAAATDSREPANREDAASQYEPHSSEISAASNRRSHGGALPR
jgi:hypothetical protein